MWCVWRLAFDAPFGGTGMVGCVKFKNVLCCVFPSLLWCGPWQTNRAHELGFAGKTMIVYA